MSFKRLMCALIVLLFCAGCGSVAWAAEGVEAQDTKIEIVNIPSAKMSTAGEMLALNDEETLEEKIMEWPLYFRSLAGLSADDQEAGLTLDTIDYSEIDIHTPGDYAVTVTLRLMPCCEEDFFISDAVRTLKIPVRVSDPEIFDLWIFRVLSDNFRAKWLYPASSPEILYTKSARKLDMADIKKEEWKVVPPEMGLLGDSFFSVFRHRLSLNTYYYFKLAKGEEHSDIVWFFEDGIGEAYGGIGGDRDGGDGSVAQPPDYTQPPPDKDVAVGTQPPPDVKNDPPQTAPTTGEGNPSDGEQTEKSADTAGPTDADKPVKGRTANEKTQGNQAGKVGNAEGDSTTKSVEQQAEAFQESFGETTDIISGSRLSLMLQNSDTARFSKQGITVALSKKALTALNISMNDRVRVEIERLGDGEFKFAVQINDQQIKALEGTQIMLPYQARQSGSELTAVHEDGTMHPVRRDTALGICDFSTDQTGRFHIEEQQIPLAAAVPSADLGGTGLFALLLCGGIALCGAGFLLWKKRVRR